MSQDIALLRRVWNWLPAIAKGIIVGQFLLIIGQLPLALLFVNLKLSPSIPWFLPITAFWLWAFWKYLGGNWWPASTSQVRRENLRGRTLTPKLWLWSLAAGGFGMVSLMGLIFVTSEFAELPPRALEPPFDVSIYPPWTVFTIFLAIAVVAGVVEEASFRGYMLSIIQRKHGWIVGILVVTIMFWLSHLSHAYATVAFIPFFMLYSTLHGLLVYFTRSTLPSIVIHSISDFLILPIQYGVVPNVGEYEFVKYGVLSIGAVLIAIPAFYRLRLVAGEVLRQ